MDFAEASIEGIAAERVGRALMRADGHDRLLLMISGKEGSPVADPIG